MLLLKKGETQDIIFTGAENSVLDNPFFLLVCTNQNLEIQVAFVVENISTTARYDKASVNTDDHFAGKQAGLWTYEIFEQESSTNVNPSGLNSVERGYMQIDEPVAFSPIVYNKQDNTYKAYEAQ